MTIQRIVFGLAIALFAQAQRPKITSFSVGPDQTLTYPSGPANPPYLVDLPDEHTTFLPPASSSAPYLIFGASKISGGTGGAVVLESSDLKNFTFAADLGYNRQVFASPVAIDQCNPNYTTEFDGNYAAPGSVLQDPTLAPGNLMIIYEAENHCPSGVNNAQYYATIGFARSSDNGKTWPASINGPSGGPSRHPILQNSVPQPTTAHPPLGDAIPSAFVDRSSAGDYYVYVVYGDHLGDGQPNLLRIARAKLGVDPLVFQKWYQGAFSQPGIAGADTPFLPTGGCAGAQEMGEVSRNDALGLYVALFVCLQSSSASWYYSTATSLDLQDWSVPQMIQNSQFPVVSACGGNGLGQQFDGWYPSSMSPGSPAGHTTLSGVIFFQSGCDTGPRVFASRTFTITEIPAPVISKVANAEGEGATIASNTWVEIKGSELTSGGDSREWQGSDFVKSQMPAQLDGVGATVNGNPAYVYYISSNQINILTGPQAIDGPVQVVVNNNGALSASFTAQAQAISPSFFVFDGTHLAATHVNGTYIGPTTLFPGLTTPAKPNEIVVLYGNGFGPTSTAVVAGSITQSGSLPTLPTIEIDGKKADVQFGGLILPGEYQFNVALPANLPDGDLAIVATYNGLQTQSGAVLTIQH